MNSPAGRSSHQARASSQAHSNIASSPRTPTNVPIPGSSTPSSTPRKDKHPLSNTHSHTTAHHGSASTSAGVGGRRVRDRHKVALESIRNFLKGRSSYDVLPVSFRLIVLDTKLVVKPALDVMWQAGVVSAPLWHSTPSAPPVDPLPLDLSESPQQTLSSSAPGALPSASGTRNVDAPGTGGRAAGFAGMLTVNDIIHLIQYYYRHSSYDNAAQDVEHFRLEMLREIEQALSVPPPPLLSVHPLRPLYEACQLLMKTHARRLPLLDHDEQTGEETVVSVLTQYRVLKFIAMNCRETSGLYRSIRSLNIGTYVGSRRTALNPGSSASSAVPSGSTSPSDVTSGALPVPTTASAEPPNPYAPLATATLDTTVFDVVHMFSERGISAVPILDEEGMAVNMYETVDVITLVRTGAYHSLDLTIRQALARRPPDYSGVVTCSPDDSLANIFALLRKRRVHRLLILEPEPSAPNAAPPSEQAAAAEQGQQRANNDEDDTPPARRGRGKLVGILCLSDILRYVIGAQNTRETEADHLSMSMSMSMSMGAGTGTGTGTGTGASQSREPSTHASRNASAAVSSSGHSPRSGDAAPASPTPTRPSHVQGDGEGETDGDQHPSTHGYAHAHEKSRSASDGADPPPTVLERPLDEEAATGPSRDAMNEDANGQPASGDSAPAPEQSGQPDGDAAPGAPNA